MFVRVISDDVSALYECDHVRMRQLDDSDHVMLTMEGVGSREHMQLDINKNTNEVYFMNRDGKTVDTYRWLPLKRPPGSEKDGQVG